MAKEKELVEVVEVNDLNNEVQNPLVEIEGAVESTDSKMSTGTKVVAGVAGAAAVTAVVVLVKKKIAPKVKAKWTQMKVNHELKKKAKEQEEAKKAESK